MDNIEQLRKKIDVLDDQLLTLIAIRIGLMKATGEAKKNIEKPIRDVKRENEKIEILRKKAMERNIPVELILRIWKIFFEASAEIEK